METVCQPSYPLNSENASPFGTRTVYLAWPVSCAEMALPPKTASTETASETTTITTAGILLLFIATPLVLMLIECECTPSVIRDTRQPSICHVRSMSARTIMVSSRRGDRRRCEPRDQQSGPYENGLMTADRRTDPREATQIPGRSSPAGRSPAPRRPPAGHTDPPGATRPSFADAGSGAPATPPSSAHVPNPRGECQRT